MSAPVLRHTGYLDTPAQSYDEHDALGLRMHRRSPISWITDRWGRAMLGS
jgi:hypothetical protein